MANADIILGVGTLYYAPTGTANPDETSVGYGTAWSSWTSLGTTLDALTLNYADTLKDVRVQQKLGVIKRFRTEVGITAKTKLAEHTGAILALLTGGTNTDTAAGASQKAFSQVTAGDDPAIDEYKFGFETYRVDSAGTKQPVRYFFHKGHIRIDGDVNFDRENETGVPVVIEVLEDTSQSAGSEFMVVDIVTAPASA